MWQAIAQIAGSVLDAFSQNSANKANKQLAKKQMAFQERMSNTEMTRRDQDLKNAGLNPMLAGANQSGASSPQGARADVKPVSSNSAQAISNAMLIKSQIDNVNADTANKQSQTGLNQGNTLSPGLIDLKVQTEIGTGLQKIESEKQFIVQSQAEVKKILANIDLLQTQIKTGQINNDTLGALNQARLNLYMLQGMTESMKPALHSAQTHNLNTQSDTKTPQAIVGQGLKSGIDLAQDKLTDLFEYLGNKAQKFNNERNLIEENKRRNKK